MPTPKEVNIQIIANWLTGGPCMAYALRESGALSVVAHNGKKHLFTPEQVEWAKKQVSKPEEKPPAAARKPKNTKKVG